MQGILGALQAFKEQYLFWLNLPQVRVVDIIEMVIIAIVLYKIMVWIKNTRAWTLFKGLAVIMVAVLVAAVFQMNTILWLAGKALSVGVITLAIIFQPELRSALERIGRENFFKKVLGNRIVYESKASDKTISDTVKACFDMGKVKTGALIVIEKNIALNEVIRTGIEVDAVVSRQLYINIFEKNTPLHDGAVIVRGDRVVSATCYLPLTNDGLDKDLGTRHRAAVGISEVSDALAIVVSEETGAVSTAYNGKITKNLRPEELEEFIRSHQMIESKKRRGNKLGGRLKNNESTKKNR